MHGYSGYNQIMVTLYEQQIFFQYRVRSTRIPNNVFWIDVRTKHLPKGYDEDICKIPRQIYEGLFNLFSSYLEPKKFIFNF